MFWKFLLPARLPELFERPRWPPSSWKDTKIRRLLITIVILLLLLFHLYHHHHHHNHLVELLIDGERNTWLDVAVDVVLHPSAVYPTDGLQLQSLGSGHLEFLQVRLCVRIIVSILLIRLWRKTQWLRENQYWSKFNWAAAGTPPESRLAVIGTKWAAYVVPREERIGSF